MATQEELYTALRNADAAGDNESAAKLVAYIKSTMAQSTPAPAASSSAPEESGGFMDRIKGLAETGTALATGGVASLAGGLNYLGTMALSGDNTAAAKAVQEDTQRALTYAPRGKTGQRYTENVGNALSYLGQNEGEYVGEKSSDLATRLGASPEVSGAIGSFLNTGIQAIPMAAGLRGGRSILSRDGKITQAPETNPFANQSMGAAGASPDMSASSPALQQAVRKAAQDTGGAVNPEVLNRHLEADSLPVKMQLTRGQATQDPSLISVEQNTRGKNPELAKHFNQQNQQLIDNLDEIRSSAAPDAVGNDHIQNGQALIDSYKNADAPIKADISQKYKTFFAAIKSANEGGIHTRFDGQGFASSADKALAGKMKGRYLPSEIAGDLADLRDGGPMTFETFENMRTNLAAAARKADRSGDGNAMAAINIVRDSLENLPLTGESAKIKPLADAARSAAKARFDKLKADPAYRAAIDDSVDAGESSPLADDFVQKYIVRGKSANLAKMRENLSADPAALQTIGSGALNYLKSKSGVNMFTNEGNFSQAGYNRALAEIMPKIQNLLPPKIAEQAQTLGNVARYTQAQPRGSFVNNSNTMVGNAAKHIGSALEGIANVKAGGLPVGTFIRKKLQASAERKFVKESMAPGAGLNTLNDARASR